MYWCHHVCSCCARSYTAGMMAETLNDSGIKTACVYQGINMITGEEKNDEVRLALTGTDSHWSNCEPGLIFKAAGEHDLVLVVPTVLNQNGWFQAPQMRLAPVK